MEVNTNKISLPLITTKNIVLFPNINAALDIKNNESVNAVKNALKEYNDLVIIVCQKDHRKDDFANDNLYDVGVIAKIKSSRLNPDNSYRISVLGMDRVKINGYAINDDFFLASGQILNDIQGEFEKEAAYVKSIAKNLNTNTNAFLAIPKVTTELLSQGVSSSILTNTLSYYLNVDLKAKQLLLETLSINDRLEMILERLNKEKLISELEKEINEKMKARLDETQKEYILREKLKIIKEELGDINSKEQDAEEIRKKLEENPYPERIKNKVLDELKKYEITPTASPEYPIIRSYIDLLLTLPWYKKNEEVIDIKDVKKTLDQDHYGLDKPKERIIEYLSVMKFTSSVKAPILCFVGAPGVGKTSLALSIARALKRNFVKISLGGVHDESEIRGHRRTYIGAMPGKIIQGMKKAKVINPVFVLDEIDKLSSDYKGDPSSALLEVLDPEQNNMFNDHYLEEHYDLSNVLFIATANYIGNIPNALRDRLEIIHLSSYTEIEKLEIAKKHLIPKQFKEHNLDKLNITFNDKAIMKIIRYYTKESGVRQLERCIAEICRKVITIHVENNTSDDIKMKIDEKKVVEFLGKEKYDYTKREKKDTVGLVNGLAYTDFGGDLIPVEVNYFAGKGKLIMTGSLGDVMKESANIGLDYIKANAKSFGIDEKIFKNIDIHIHVPEGAVPKDGPSAGVTMTTAIISALSNTPVRNDVAMTGEITLRGNILPIGGLKEKTISAHRSGIKTVIIPKDNKKDLDEIPEVVKKDIKIVFAEKFEDIIDVAFVGKFGE